MWDKVSYFYPQHAWLRWTKRIANFFQQGLLVDEEVIDAAKTREDRRNRIIWEGALKSHLEVVVEQRVIRDDQWRTTAHWEANWVGYNLEAQVHEFNERTLITWRVDVACLWQRFRGNTRYHHALTATTVFTVCTDNGLVRGVAINVCAEFEVFSKTADRHVLRSTTWTILLYANKLKGGAVELHLEFEAIDRECFERGCRAPAVLDEHWYEHRTLGVNCLTLWHPNAPVRII